MYLVHERDGESRRLADDVDTADTFLSQVRGLMFRPRLPDDYALVFRFGDVAERDVHMVFVFVPLDVLWIVDGSVRRKERLLPWRGFAIEEADTLVELPAGAAAEVAEGDRVRLVE
ncbi:MAG: DUF192 domain-containing protein [Halanaeroarchaeum sp.]